MLKVIVQQHFYEIKAEQSVSSILKILQIDSPIMKTDADENLLLSLHSSE
jgi:hypothetical protein